MVLAYMMNYYDSDPEFRKIMEHFILEEVMKEPGQELPEETRYLAVLSRLLGCQGITFCFLAAQGRVRTAAYRSCKGKHEFWK